MYSRLLLPILVLIGSSAESIAGQCRTEYTWYDWRWESTAGREVVVEDARRELERLYPDFRHAALVEFDAIGYEVHGVHCSSVDYACYQLTYSRKEVEECCFEDYSQCPTCDMWQPPYVCQDMEEYKSSRRAEFFGGFCAGDRRTSVEETCKRQIRLNDCIFEQGVLDLDPSGSILTEKNYQEVRAIPDRLLRYRFALDLREAVEFALLHEFAHYLGMADAPAHEFARSMLIELRKAQAGQKPSFRQFPEFTSECTQSQARSTAFASDPRSLMPPDLPPGTQKR